MAYGLAAVRVGGRLAAVEFHDGRLPEVRELARRLQSEHRRQARRMAAWRHARSRTRRQPRPAQAVSSGTGMSVTRLSASTIWSDTGRSLAIEHFTVWLTRRPSGYSTSIVSLKWSWRFRSTR
jgi:Domain of unknown function (DUF305)